MAVSITYYTVLKDFYFSDAGFPKASVVSSNSALTGFLLRLDEDSNLHIFDTSGNPRSIIFNMKQTLLTSMVTAGYLSAASSTAPAAITAIPAVNTVTQGAPVTTVSLTSVMAGLAVSLTTINSPRVLITASGQLSNNTALDGSAVDVRYGTGVAPAAAAAVTGTVAGLAQTVTSVSANQGAGFSISAVVTGLTAGTPYWFDLSLKAVTGGTASVSGVTFTVIEM